MGGKKRAGKSGRVAFTLIIGKDAARARKALAPAPKPHVDMRRKKPRRSQDYLADTAE
ncbi:MAG: hypothetical protein Q8O35_12655 [Humidesulfovibrio sp.]|uniref:hypothetical protein n=1 Tax=Humidesulfovibrio sp. TaxID=2910988 RepID=UPI00273755B3|nr:hypothetical protein [Humidesulfovibrio sp.]MDP2849021.1 hypothetical protein [Humidesulfovibrio sp.]